MGDSSIPHSPRDGTTADVIAALTVDLFDEHNLLDLEEHLELFEEIAEPARFAILYALSNDGRMSAKELGEALDRSENALHYHLDRLVDAGLVDNRRRQRPDEEGLYSYYELTGLGADLIDAVAAFIRQENTALEQY